MQTQRFRFSVLSIDANDAEVQDFIQRLTESDEEYARRRQAERPDDAAEPPGGELRR